MVEHKLLFSLIVLASFANVGWMLIVYILFFHGARWLVDPQMSFSTHQQDKSPLLILL